MANINEYIIKVLWGLNLSIIFPLGIDVKIPGKRAIVINREY